MRSPSFIYSSRYLMDIGAHVFPVRKYLMVHDRLLDEEVATEDDFYEPQPASEADLLLVHTPEYLQDLQELRWTERTVYSELPLTHEIVRGAVLNAGGTLLACEHALTRGAAVHLGGGWHHAFADHAEGFCYINDVAVAIRVLQRRGPVERVLIVDCDLHQGNGTARIFQGDPGVFTFSIHQENLYPLKEKSDLDIGLPDWTGDDEYLLQLETHLPRLVEDQRPQLVVYLAGADPYVGDQLGSLSLSMEGLRRRDRLVLGECRRAGVPVAAVFAGGYALDINDTVLIHVNTCRTAIDLFQQ